MQTIPGFNIPLSAMCSDVVDSDPFTPREGPGINVETARKHRYLLEVLSPLGSSSADGILFFLKACTRPSAEIDEIVIHNGQDEIYRPGKNRWRALDMTFYEVLSTENDEKHSDLAANKIFSWWARKVLNIDKSRLQVNPTVDMQLSMLDGSGRSVWTYYLYRCWPLKITPSDLSYADTDLAEISLTLRFDKADER